jgi:hypothetical protein
MNLLTVPRVKAETIRHYLIERGWNVGRPWFRFYFSRTRGGQEAEQILRVTDFESHLGF